MLNFEILLEALKDYVKSDKTDKRAQNVGTM